MHVVNCNEKLIKVPRGSMVLNASTFMNGLNNDIIC